MTKNPNINNNKEYLLKYKEQFLYWLEGGAIWCGTNHPTIGWHWSKVDSFEPFPDTVLQAMVIDNEYTPFLKALAEGKIVQLRSTGEGGLYKDVSFPALFNKPLDRYRIKPDEPQFKVGDWIRYEDATEEPTVHQILTPEQLKQANSDSCVHFWKPQPGEWCWYNNGHTSAPTLVKYHGQPFSLCEPFIGTLPTHLKENKC